MTEDQFESELQAFSKRALSIKDKVSTEEAVKISVVLPFLRALGYDPTNPDEIIPEYTADVGIKRGEKVDYAISLDGQTQVLIECKSPHTKLRFEHASQLCRYFHVVSARVAILTNGFQWKFYTDSERRNVMDEKPFLAFDLEKLDAKACAQVAKFKRQAFCLDDILETASELKYRAALEDEFRQEILEPSDDMVDLLARRVCDTGRFTSNMRERFKPLVRASINEVIRGSVSSLLAKALEQNSASSSEGAEEQSQAPEIVTTPEEHEGYQIVRAICSELVSSERITMRDQKSYCAILLDDNNRKTIARLWFNGKARWYLGLFDNEAEERESISSVEEIYRYAHRLRAAVRNHLSADDKMVTLVG